ncbi:MAG: TetR/AcrR family transcriptional regulator [Clostridia bacterium]|nr:TetR/AcrR family transcriptional regulator [Clostridia bacterium]
MDLRIFKTRKEIRRAFLALRADRMPDEIRVADICREADINKTTFYKHYEDLQALSEDIEKDSLVMVINEFEEKEALLENPRAYGKGLLSALEKQKKTLSVVFRGRAEVMGAKLEEMLSAFYSAEQPVKKIKISFIIGGLIGVFKDHLFGKTDGTLKEAVAEYSAQVLEWMDKISLKD